MDQETVTYLTNIVICAILAVLMTHHWVRNARPTDVRYWMISAWVMTAADLLFALRPQLPHWMDRTLPTLLVTIGHCVLFLSAEKTSGTRFRPRLATVLVLLHAAGLVYFYVAAPAGNWRMVLNGAVWALFAFASFRTLRRGPAVFANSIVSPATFFLLHAGFHALRAAGATVFNVLEWADAYRALQIVGDLEVSFFMVALYVSLLVADLQKRNEELSRALAEVRTLSGLLPICSWCKKVRDDEGYWTKVEDYFRDRSRIVFTHGICTDCAQEHFRRDRPAEDGNAATRQG